MVDDMVVLTVIEHNLGFGVQEAILVILMGYLI